MENELTIVLQDPEILALVCGTNDCNLKLIENYLGVPVFTRGNELTLCDEREEVQQRFKFIIDRLTDELAENNSLKKGFDNGKELIESILNTGFESFDSQSFSISIPGSARKVYPKTKNQALLIKEFRKNNLVFATGPAGSGKTFLAIAESLRLLLSHKINSIVLVRPIVEAGESLGFLPGDLQDKINPYLRPLYDSMNACISGEVVKKMQENGIIEVAPLAYMRGRTLNNAAVILDEAQNTTCEQMKMFLTRMGENSKFFITGDVSQIDLPKKIPSGLVQALEILKNIGEISIVELDSEDVVRSPLVKKLYRLMRIAKMNNAKLSFSADMIHSAAQYVKKNWALLLVFILTFVVTSGIVYFDASTQQTIASFSIDEYEPGMIADKTIIANKSMSADEQFPIAIEEGEKVIRKGFAIADEDYLKLRKMASSPSYIDYRVFADHLLFLMLVSALAFLLFTPVFLGHKAQLKEMILVALLFVIVFAIASFGDKAPLFQGVYKINVIIPSALCVALVTILFGQVFALYFSFIISFGVLCACGFELIPFLYTLASSLTLVRILRNIESRIDMIFSSISVALMNIIYICVLKVMFNDNFEDALFVLSGVAFNGFISGILALGLLTPLEILMNTASVFRLMDLSDQNSPVLRKLLLTASGTYQHSIMVSQLAESACKEIGANSLLARVAALYHDIGKMEHPEYFTENNIDSENKHTDLNPSLSVSIIKSHLRISVEKAHAMHLPESVVNIISEHHGNSVIAYFYNKAKEKDPSVSEADFRYDGKLPSTKESAVVMLADVCEAACKSLEKPTAQRLEKFIQTLIDSKIAANQLDDCALTYGEMTKIKDTFVSILAAYYHGRIKYQNQDSITSENSNSEKKTEGEKNE